MSATTAPIIAHAETELYLTLLQLSAAHPALQDWLAQLPSWLAHIKDKSRYAHAPHYASLIARLPAVLPAYQRTVDLNASAVTVTLDWTTAATNATAALLKQLMPWRKGPFLLGAQDDPTRQVLIDTEWRSDYKWQRLAAHIGDLTDKRVLDVGGGSGYHGWRMVGAGAASVVVIDPSCLFYHQFMALRHFVGDADRNRYGRLATHFIPVGLEALPASGLFHTVFSMGVLYHRAAPFEFLAQLKAQLAKGGELVLETLVIDGDATRVLVPSDRYAQMNNVYFIPSVAALTQWLQKAGFVNVRCVDIDETTTDEQRATVWMTFHSLKDFLHPDDTRLTVEGYPRPKRAIMLANKP